jgi:putative ABC transport system ATP-binding protein
MSLLIVDNVTKDYRQGGRAVSALRGVSLTVSRGQFLAVMGASGSGKSTLLHLMAGLTTPTSGRIIINDQNIAAMKDHELTLFRRRNVGLVFQAFNLIPTLSAFENMVLPLMLDGKESTHADNKAQKLFDVLGLSQRSHHRPDALSGGEQQRVAIGRALIADPAVILADEPTGNLDSITSHGVCELLRELSAVHGRTIVMVTHEPSVAAYAQEVAIMKDGQLIRRFPTHEISSTEELASKYQEVLRTEVA